MKCASYLVRCAGLHFHLDSVPARKALAKALTEGLRHHVYIIMNLEELNLEMGPLQQLKSQTQKGLPFRQKWTPRLQRLVKADALS